MLPIERVWREVLLDAMIPPSARFPGLAQVDRGAFWPRFAASAPWSLRFGLRIATWCLAGVAPLLLGYRRTLAALDAAARDEVLQRATSLPGGEPLLLVVKLVACFAYFDDPAVQAVFRERRP